METLDIKSTFRWLGGTPAQIFNLARFSSVLVNTRERRCVKCAVLVFFPSTLKLSGRDGKTSVTSHLRLRTPLPHGRHLAVRSAKTKSLKEKE